ncbi:MAG: OadG family protein [Propionibacteriaceae bacterium]|nr:OadG family protein [Propionibacteriaceae bacterium]
MSIPEAVTVGLFCMAVVFVVLIVLWGAVAGFARVIGALEKLLDGSGGPSGGRA